MRIIRFILGQIILLVNFLTPPKAIQHTAEVKKKLMASTQELTLYHYKACPFCVKVRRHLKRLDLNIAMRDVKREPNAHQALLAGGGKIQVPCLHIPADGAADVWLYESSEIIAYLDQLLAQAAA